MGNDNFPLRRGSEGPRVKQLAQAGVARFNSYAKEFDGTPLKADGYFGLGEEAFARNWQGRMKLPVTGQVSEDEFNLIIGNRTTIKDGVVPGRRKIWIYTAPGSGANWWQGPSFDLGERCKNILKLNHQPIAFQMGGYLGFMGGDSKFSYNDVIWDQYKSLEYNLDHNPDINDPDLELWFSGYSQSADGMEAALEMLFGDGGFIHPGDPSKTPSAPGKYRHLRSRINGVVQYGNPSTAKTGIARKVRSPWLAALIRNVNMKNDFYAVAPDDIRPAFYAIIVEAEMELPFFVHVLKVAVPVIMNVVPIFGGLFGPLGQMAVAGMAGLQGSGLLSQMMGQAAGGGDEDLHNDLVEMLSVTGLIKNVPGLIGLVGALPGLQAHGEYHLPKPEFGGRTGVDVAYDIIAGFKR